MAGLREIAQGRATISTPVTPAQSEKPKPTHSRRSTAKPAKPAKPALPLFAQPTSARGILRRLAKITATTSQRRQDSPLANALTPTPFVAGSDDEDDVKPPPPFSIEESMGEDTSETMTIPEVTVLEGDTDEDDEVPEMTVLEDAETRTIRVRSETPDGQNDRQDESTMMTERGRRAVSNEPTQMSRYSFGSIHMSGFGSELEVRRESTVLPAADEVNEEGLTVTSKAFDLGPETEDLRNLQRSPSSDISAGGFEVGTPYPDRDDSGGDDFQLELDEDDEAHGVAEQRANFRQRLVDADSILIPELSVLPEAEKQIGPADGPRSIDAAETEDESADQHFAGDEAEAEAALNQPAVEMSLLETVAAEAHTQAQRTKKLKVNRLGNMVPAIPSSLMKKIIHESQEQAGKRKVTLGKEHMRALEQASEWFFEQVSQDLSAISAHGRRKRINQDDALLVLKRQRIQGPELHQLAKQWLPRETRDQLDLPEAAL